MEGSHRNPGDCSERFCHGSGRQSSQTQAAPRCVPGTRLSQLRLAKAHCEHLLLHVLGMSPYMASHSNKGVEAITVHRPTCNVRGTPRSMNLACVSYITLADALFRVICTRLYVFSSWSLFSLVEEHLGGWSSLEGFGSDRTCIP